MAIEVLRLTVGQLEANCFIIADSRSNEALIIDPGDDADFIAQKITDLRLTPLAMIATHGHFDHVMAGFELQKIFRIPLYLHPKDMFLLKRLSSTASYFLGRQVVALPPQEVSDLSKGETTLGPFIFQVIETPGHTPGSVSLYFGNEKMVFVGDLMFAQGGIGRTDFKYSSHNDLLSSLQKLFFLPGNTIVYTGHGMETTIEQEKA